MKDFKLTIVIDVHLKNDYTDDDIEMIIDGLKRIFSGSTSNGYIKVQDVRIEEI